MSRENTKQEMYQPTTERINSLTIDCVARQAVPESGTGRTVRSVADGRNRTLGTSSRCVRADSEPMPVSHVGMNTVVTYVLPFRTVSLWRCCVTLSYGAIDPSPSSEPVALLAFSPASST